MHEVDEIKVWDPFLRLFHWSLVAAFFIAYIVTDDDQLSIHVIAGYVVGGLVLFRIIWGFVGPTRARFSDFLYPPKAIFGYLRDTLLGRATRYLGHSPAGGAMVIALLIALSVLTVSGLMLYAIDEQAGPLAPLMGGMVIGQAHANQDDNDGEQGESMFEEVLEDLHEMTANLSLFLAVLHIVGVFVASLAHKENLVRAMITGYKRK